MISIFTLCVITFFILLVLIFNTPAPSRLRLYESKPVKRAIDHYQIAAEYDYERGDREQAREHYRRALELAPETPEDAWFIMERVGTRIRRPAVEADEQHAFELDLQRVWDMTRTELQHRNIHFAAPARQTWHEDTQNVHDSLLSDTVATQFRELRKLGRDEPGTHLYDIIRELQNRPVMEGRDEAIQMLGYIQRHDASVTKLGTTEPVLVQEVWKQVKRVGTRDIMQSFCTQLRDSWNGGHPHCVTGRISRTVQSLAHMVPDSPEIGQLKTREAVRNEIFQSASKKLQDRLREDGMEGVWAKSGLADSTNPLTDDEQGRIATFTERVKADIASMVDEYTDIAPADRGRIKEECYAALE
jgi:hypothetical protein